MSTELKKASSSSKVEMTCNSKISKVGQDKPVERKTVVLMALVEAQAIIDNPRSSRGWVVSDKSFTLDKSNKIVKK